MHVENQDCEANWLPHGRLPSIECSIYPVLLIKKLLTKVICHLISWPCCAHCSLFPKGSCYVASQSPASVPFHGLFSFLMILAQMTFLFLVVSSTHQPRNPFCNHKPEPSFMAVKISKTCVWATSYLPKMTVQTNSLNRLCRITQVPGQVAEPSCMGSEVLHGERSRK